MKILRVTVRKEFIEVKYERKDGWWVRKKYVEAPKNVFDFMMTHECITKRNGDYLYTCE